MKMINFLSIVCLYISIQKYRVQRNGGDGQVVSVLVFYSDDPSSNPAEVNMFPMKVGVEKRENNQ